MQNTTANKNKFTATLVTEETKNAVVALRNETGLGEKELMTLVVNAAIAAKDTIIAQATQLIEANKLAQEQRRKDAYAALKQKLAATREAKKADKPAKPTTSKPTKTPSTKAAAVAA